MNTKWFFPVHLETQTGMNLYFNKNMQYKTLIMSNEEKDILLSSLNFLIKKIEGITPPQENYINNIDKGLPIKQADEIFKQDNLKYWQHMVDEIKNPIYILFLKLRML